MGSSPRSFRIAALAAGSVGLAAAITFAGGAEAAGPASFCRASLLQVSIAGNALPELASAEGCIEQEGGVGLIDLDPIPVKARLLYAHTNSTAPNAESGVADLTIDLSAGGGPVIGVQVLKSEASATCNGTTPVLSGKSRVVGLTLDGEDTPLVIPPGDEYTEIPADPLVNIKLNEQVKTASTITQNALHVHALTDILDIDVVVAQSQAGITGNPCEPTTTTTTGGTTAGGTTGNPPPLPAQKGWMNGGGTMVDSSGTTVDPGTSVSHGFVLPCFVDQTPPGGENLVVNGDFGHFKLDTVDSVKCTMVADQGDPENPKATFNTQDGTGTGTCDGLPATVRWHFTDEGEPNTADEATIHITSTPNTCHVDVVGILTNDNNQAHPLNDKGSSSAKKQS